MFRINLKKCIPKFGSIDDFVLRIFTKPRRRIFLKQNLNEVPMNLLAPKQGETEFIMYVAKTEFSQGQEYGCMGELIWSLEWAKF